MFISTLVLFAFSALVIPSASSVDHQVTVGGVGINAFDPEYLDAEPGDRIVFTIKQGSHSVTRSSLDAPCVPLNGGFDSGIVDVPDNTTTGFTQAELNITDSDPIWVHCRQEDHCRQGMVFAINPGDQFDEFKANALNTTDADIAAAEAATIECPQLAGTNHIVTVGQNGALVFSPNNVTADVGDTITFRFAGGNNSVVQSTFAAPCSPMALSSSSGQIGFDSGFRSLSADEEQFPTFSITVNNSAPIWAFCGQTDPMNHCQQGMVFAVNAVAVGNTFDAFLANAMGSSSAGAAGAPVLKTNDTPDDGASRSSKPNGARGPMTINAGVVVAVVAAVAAGLL